MHVLLTKIVLPSVDDSNPYNVKEELDEAARPKEHIKTKPKMKKVFPRRDSNPQLSLIEEVDEKLLVRVNVVCREKYSAYVLFPTFIMNLPYRLEVYRATFAPLGKGVWLA